MADKEDSVFLQDSHVKDSDLDEITINDGVI